MTLNSTLNLEPSITLTTCPYCAVQCSFEIEHATQADGREALLGLRSTPRCPVAHGSVCKKGLAALEEPNHPERLLSPLVRKNGKLVPASWNEALERITRLVNGVQSKYGRDAFGVFGGGSLTNEKVYLLGKFARVALRTANIDYNGRFCMSTAGAAMRQTYGLDRGLPFPLERVAEASCIVLWGSNLAETLPPIAQFVTRARKRGASIIVVDPRATPSTKLGTIHIPVQPGGDLALALGLQNVIVSENWQDQDFLEARTIGWDAVAESVKSCTPAWAAAQAGLQPIMIRELARLMAEKSREPGGLLILSGRGPEQQSQGVDTIKAMINLALSLGGFYAPLTGQGNGQGGREHGQKADQLPGYQLIENPDTRAKMSAFWGIAERDLPHKGLSAQELLENCGGVVKGLFVMGSNPAISAANSANVSRKLEALDGLVVVDFYLSETAALADVVLPGSMWLEEDGTMTNLEGRVLRRRQVSNPPGEARADWKILCEIARRLGMNEGFQFSSPQEIFDELARATRGAPADYSGISYERLEGDGIFWPCPSKDHPGTPEPFKTSFAHADGRAHLSVTTHKRNLEQTNSEYPVWLSTGRLAEHYQSGTQTRRNKRLNKVTRPSLELHPNLAAFHKLERGDRVRVTTARGEAEFDVAVSSNIREDTIFAPFHFAGVEAVNRVTNPMLDPVSRMPAFKVSAANIERIGVSEANAFNPNHVSSLPRGYNALISGVFARGSRTRVSTPAIAAFDEASAQRRVVTAATLGFTMMFAIWVIFAIIGVPLSKELGLNDGQFALLTAIPILTGSLLRLPAGIIAERYGGKNSFFVLMLATASTMFLLPWLTTFSSILSLAFFIGLAGVSFAIGNAWIAAWVPRERQGFALGTFGAGNVGASITKLIAPILITVIPASSALTAFWPLAGWRIVPSLYGVLLLVTAFFLYASAPRDKIGVSRKGMTEWLEPLKNVQVWRFGLYYVIFFGAYVALSLSLPRYYIKVYEIDLQLAGLLTALFIFPASLLRPVGGYLSDKFGARPVTLASFIVMIVAFAALALPSSLITLPVFVSLTVLMGVGMGVGKASNYKLVTHWYGKDIGVVGGLVGLLGGLGGFVLPLVFAGIGHDRPQNIFFLLTVLATLSFALFYVSVLRLEIKRLRDDLERAQQAMKSKITLEPAREVLSAD